MNTDPEYLEYCRYWQVYLHRIDEKDPRFRDQMLHCLPSDVRVERWPLIWPEICYLFSPGDPPDWEAGKRNFVAAVRATETSCP